LIQQKDLVEFLAKIGKHYCPDLGCLMMSDELSEEILKELKKINEKLDHLNEPKGLSSATKIIAFVVIGPVVALLLVGLFQFVT
jgi:hypothetical protein